MAQLFKPSEKLQKEGCTTLTRAVSSSISKSTQLPPSLTIFTPATASEEENYSPRQIISIGQRWNARKKKMHAVWAFPESLDKGMRYDAKQSNYAIGGIYEGRIEDDDDEQTTV